MTRNTYGVKYSVIVPCYNTQPIFQTELEEIAHVFKEVIGTELFEVVLVNDCSPNPNTLQFLREMQMKWPFIKLIDLLKNTGQANAQMAALHYVSGEIIISLDDDMQTHPKNIPMLLDELEKGYDVVLGKYITKKHNFFRRALTKMDNAFETVFLEKPKSLAFNSFWVARRYITDAIIEYKFPYSFMEGLFLRTTSKISNVEIEHFQRVEGNSGYTLKSLVRLWSNFTNFTVKPLRIAMYLGIFTVLIGVVLSIVTVARRIIYPDIPAGYTAIVCICTFFFGITLLNLGVMGEYIGRIFMCINSSPQYIVRNVYDNEEEKACLGE